MYQTALINNFDFAYDNYLKEQLNINYEKVLWAVGNHDTKSGNAHWIPKHTKRPLEYIYNHKNVIFQVFNASYVSEQKTGLPKSCKLIKNQIKAFIVIFTPAFLITLQPDVGSALIYVAFFFVLHREGLTLNYIILGTLLIVLFLLTILFGVTLLLSSLFI